MSVSSEAAITLAGAAVIYIGGYVFFYTATHPTPPEPIPYHAKCFQHGAVIWEGDFVQRGFWKYTVDGRELFLPDDPDAACITTGR